MSTTALAATDGRLTMAAMRSFIGLDVIVETVAGAAKGRLLSCVRDSAWFVVDDDDVVLHLGDIVSIRSG